LPHATVAFSTLALMSVARILVLVLVLLPLAAGGAEPVRSPDRVGVATVLAGSELRLADGQIVRLAGIRVPEAVGPAARQMLRTLLQAAGVRLRPDDPPVDRWGRLVAGVELADGRSLQAALLEQGLAVVEPGPDVLDLARLQARERAARAAGQGIWARADAVLPADPARLAPGFAIVRGEVRKLARTRSAVYLNFGEPWWADFTLKIGAPEIEQAFAARGLALDRLPGRTVEARGFIVEAGGPLIELFQPDQLEVVR